MYRLEWRYPLQIGHLGANECKASLEIKHAKMGDLFNEDSSNTKPLL